MQGPSLSAPELSFINQHTQTIDSVAADLSDLFRQMGSTDYYRFRLSEDAIISRITPLASFTRDVEYTLRALLHQTLDLIHSRLPAPLANFEGESVPVLFTVVERSQFDGTLTSLHFHASASYSLVDPQQAMRAVSSPLAKFLASRFLQRGTAAVTPTTPNVRVDNAAPGWLIVYSPYYVSSENGFGGPSGPVDGFLQPGRYRFGIKQTGPAQWDNTTSWNIPAQNTPYIPLP